MCLLLICLRRLPWTHVTKRVSAAVFCCPHATRRHCSQSTARRFKKRLDLIWAMASQRTQRNWSSHGLTSMRKRTRKMLVLLGCACARLDPMLSSLESDACPERASQNLGTYGRAAGKRRVPRSMDQDLGNYLRAAGKQAASPSGVPKNAAESGHLLRTEQLESDACPEGPRRIWAPTKEQLGSGVCPEESIRIWAPTEEQLENDMCPEEWIRIGRHGYGAAGRQPMPKRMAQNWGTYYQAAGKRRVPRRTPLSIYSAIGLIGNGSLSNKTMRMYHIDCVPPSNPIVQFHI